MSYSLTGQTGVQLVTPAAAQATEDINESFTQTNPTEYASVTEYSTDWETLIEDTSSINEANIKTVSFNNEWMYGEGPTITYNEIFQSLRRRNICCNKHVNSWEP